jgi:hypothetical protein
MARKVAIKEARKTSHTGDMSRSCVLFIGFASGLPPTGGGVQSVNNLR